MNFILARNPTLSSKGFTHMDYVMLREAYPDAKAGATMLYCGEPVELVSFPWYEEAERRAKIMIRTTPGDPTSMREVPMDSLESTKPLPTDASFKRGLLLLLLLMAAVILFALFSPQQAKGQTAKPVQAQHTQTAGNPSVMVWVTPKGKVYHTWRDCVGLERSSSVLVSNEAAAEQHGLRLCGICAHRHHVQADNKDWAKPEAK